MMETKGLVAGLETGGTKIICAVSSPEDPLVILDRIVIPTEVPAKSVPQVKRFLAGHHRDRGIAAVGIGSFGPVDIDENSDTFGVLLNTPKVGWGGTNVHDFLGELTGVPSAVVTDVDAALLGERYAGAAVDTEDAAYITVGTGVGVSLMAGGRLVSGFRHAELGHILLRRHAEDTFQGICPVHGDCLEGLVSGPALGARSQTESESDLTRSCAYYLGQLCSTLALTGVPERIIVGGGVSQREGLLRGISDSMRGNLHDYLAPTKYFFSDASAPTIVSPGLRSDAGVIGALRLAVSLLE